jgi:hypothetical protein
MGTLVFEKCSLLLTKLTLGRVINLAETNV